MVIKIFRKTFLLFTLLLIGNLLVTAQTPEAKMSKEDRVKVLKWLT